MQNFNHVLDRAEQICVANGTKLTPKRKQILSGLLKANKAMSAYELVDSCKENFGESIPAMSVYRILDFLQEEGLVHKLDVVSKYVACSHITCHHAHEVPQFLICDKCQAVKEVSVGQSVLDRLRSKVEEADFYLSSPQIEMSCVCAACYSQLN